jgi:hypothetical protein
MTRGAALAAAIVTAVVTLAAGSRSPEAAAHNLGCTLPSAQPPPGDSRRVYALPHGCAWLITPADAVQKVPVVVVRQHGGRGRVITRRFHLPTTNLPQRPGGTFYICHDSFYYFIVAYPFITVIASTGFKADPPGISDCGTPLLFWTLQLSPPPSLRGHWLTHAPPG